MKATEIISMNALTISTPNAFKDTFLAQATETITAIYNDAAKYAETKNREIAKVLGQVAEKKAYEKDGFKSVADYAHTIFGIAKNNAYALASAGRVYNDKNAHPELKAMSPSKIAELKSLEPKIVKEALDSGKINHETTQKDLREFAEKAKATGDSSKAEVLDTFTARPCIPVLTEDQADTFSSNKPICDWDDWFTGYVSNVSPGSPVEIISLKKLEVTENNVKHILQRRLYMNRTYSVVVEYYKYSPKTDKAKKPQKPKFTREELMAMLEALDDNK